MLRNYNQQPDVQLIPFHEFDPEIHNIEYRYFESPEYQNTLNQYYAQHYNQTGQVGDFRSAEDSRRPYPYYGGGRPRPFYPPFAPFFPPFYGGGGYGYPYGGGYGYHPYGGGYGGYGYHKESHSR